VTTVRSPASTTKKPLRPRRASKARRRWIVYVCLPLSVLVMLACGITSYYYVTFSRMIDARLAGEMERSDPRVFARPFVVRRGQRVTLAQMVDRLNDLGYAQRPKAERPGEFAIGRDAMAVMPRGGDEPGQIVRFTFAVRPNREPGGLQTIELPSKRRTIDALELDAPLLASLSQGREKRRDLPLTAIPPRMVQAVLATEDRRFYDHPGVDVIGTTRAVFSNLFGSHRYLSGGSTITQQLVRNTFISSMWGLEKAQEKSAKRKFTEWLMSVALERRLSKDQILQMYLNDVYLGQRGSFAIHGVPEAARLFFGKDVSNVSLTEAATIAGVIQAPPRYSPFNNPDRSRERRNVVLHAMADSDYITEDAADRASHEPLQVVARALESEAPYFVDYVSQDLQEKVKTADAVDVYTTLDLHLQRLAQEAVRGGLDKVDAILSKRKHNPGQAQAALIAVDPRTGEILAMVGGRSYNQSQYNRAVSARRQPGSTFKPFVYLAAFERAQADGRSDMTPATIVNDEPTSFLFNDQEWTPQNYENEYDGPITLRRALAMSRNIATIKVAEATGYDNVAALWKRVGAGTPPRPYPSIALGVFEATPFEIASAYTLFPNLGTIRPLHGVLRIIDRGKPVPIDEAPPRTVARRDTTYLVTDMMRSVLNEGTGAAARSMGFSLDAAGKSGTTNDYRDAWFVGFTPDLLTVVWVGLDDNQILGLSGSRAALPIWADFMTHALAGHSSAAFDAPDGIVFADIDRDTGQLATPLCPHVIHQPFLAGTQPLQSCTEHGSVGLLGTVIR
jgi:penicillin-binding protein 1B